MKTRQNHPNQDIGAFARTVVTGDGAWGRGRVPRAGALRPAPKPKYPTGAATARRHGLWLAIVLVVSRSPHQTNDPNQHPDQRAGHQHVSRSTSKPSWRSAKCTSCDGTGWQAGRFPAQTGIFISKAPELP